MAKSSSKSLPPGTTGWPLLGETLAFLKDPFGIIDRGVAKYGPIFRTNILGQDTIVVSGAEAADQFIQEHLVVRAGGTPKHVQELLGGRSLGVIDGQEHRTRKRQVLAGFMREALVSYVPAMQKTVESYFARWTKEKEVVAVPELKRLALETIAKNVLSLEGGPKFEAMLEDFKKVTAGVTGIPIALPGTRYKEGLEARDRIMAMMREAAGEHRKRPIDDGLSRILGAKADDGSTLSDQDAAMELHHINIAGYIIFAEFACILIQLSKNPSMADRLKGEVRAHAQSGALSIDRFDAMPYLLQFVKEVKRMVPIVPALFGTVVEDFELGGYLIPKGWKVWWGVRTSNHDSRMFKEPERFDPDRFGPGRAEDQKHPHAYAPHGAGPATGHKCPGTDYATLFMQVFTTVLLRDYAMDVPSQNLELEWSMIPPEPKDGLKLSLRRGEESGKQQLGTEVFLALAAIIWADGKVTDSERRALIDAAVASGIGGADLDKVKRATEERTDLSRVSSLPLTGDEREFVYAIAAWLTRVDGVVTSEEIAALGELAGILSLTPEQRSRIEIASMALRDADGARDLSALATEIAKSV
jgi:cytochrome P450